MSDREQGSTFLRRTLAAAGLSTDFNAAIAHLSATYVRDHQHFSRLLTEMDSDYRHPMYEAMRPQLSFEALPLENYISMAKEMAERQQLPLLSPTGQLLSFAPARDASGITEVLKMRCGKCTNKATFRTLGDESRVDVIIKARRAGWVYDNKGEFPREICPECSTPLREAHEAYYGKQIKIDA